jgi:hypothetical protein
VRNVSESRAQGADILTSAKRNLEAACCGARAGKFDRLMLILPASGDEIFLVRTGTMQGVDEARTKRRPRQSIDG